MIFLADAHCDTITKIYNNKKNLYNNDCHISIQKLQIYKNALQTFSIWLDDYLIKKPFQSTLNVIDFFYEQINKYNNYIEFASSYDEIIQNMKNNKISAMLSIEGGEALEGNIGNLKCFYELGVRALILTWNRKNDLGHGVGSVEKKGLTKFGKDVVCEMQNLKMIVDVSHINEWGFWDVLSIAKNPIIASHSNSYKICQNNRNLEDDQIKSIFKCGGVIGINIYPRFLTKSNQANILDILNHIEHIMGITSENSICLGCDFDGIDESVIGINEVSDLTKLYNYLEKIYDKKIVDKIFFQNYLDFIKRCC